MSTLYQIYHESVVKLAATLVVKDEATCNYINRRMSFLGYEVDPNRPETWKYYLNLNGQYHSSDKMMKVRSMDTREEIDFTVENMLIHRATWREYAYGSRYYKELTSKYPNQKALIRAILNPIDIEKAVSAPDHSILYYDTSLVEARETNLISELQHWITAQFVRWANTDYSINNTLFFASRIAILAMTIPARIKSIRLENAKTNRAHSYHIRRYLASFGPLDQYYDQMNEFQRLYFYRNIRHITRNHGKDETFKELIRQVMTRRNFPIAEYAIQQNDGELVENFDPATQYERTSLNGIPSALGEDIIDTPKMLELQRTVARGNPEEITDAEVYVPNRMARNLNAVAKTKVLESNVLDLKESEPYTLADILMNQWIYLADLGLYQTVMPLQLSNASDAFKLTMKEAYIVYQYLFMKRLGIELVEIPRIMAKRVRRITPPTFEELRTLTTSAITPDKFIREAMRDVVPITNYVSVDSFLDLSIEIQRRMLLHRDLYVYREDLFQYAELKLVTDRFYMDIPVDMDNGQNYAEWLSARNLNFEGFTPSELDEIMLDILNYATGFELRASMSLKDIQRAMLGIMSQLSSYSVQFIQQINESAVTMFDWPHLRWHYLGGSVGHDLRVPVVVAGAKKLHSKAKLKAVIDAGCSRIFNFDHESKHHTVLPLELKFDMSGLNQYIRNGVVLGATIAALKEPTKDLSELNGTVLSIPQLESRSIADLFLRNVINDLNTI